MVGIAVFVHIPLCVLHPPSCNVGEALLSIKPFTSDLIQH